MIDALTSHLKGISFSRDVSLADHTSFGIGGPSTLFIEVQDETIFSNLLKATTDLGVDTLILGGGTNLLVSDEGFDGLTIKMNFEEIHVDEDDFKVRVGAGVQTAHLVDTLIDAELKGLEFAAGLPGTVGGAIAGNAGCFGHTLSDFMVRATVVESDGTIRTVDDMGWFNFDYRHTNLTDRNAVISNAVFKLERGNRKALEEEAKGYLQVRREKHPAKGVRTAGSYFKNLPPLTPGGRRRAAGALLDQAGAHGLSVGDAAVFERHANIIINRGNARARDVLELASMMKDMVKKKFGVELEEEVRFVGKRPALICES